MTKRQHRSFMQSELDLRRGRIVVWRCDLRTIDCRSRERLNLDQREATRAAAFVFERDRWRYAVGRTLLKALLARYLNCEPRAVRLGLSPSEKPFLMQPSGADLRFNVSHSEDIYVVALGTEDELGVDIELHRKIADARDLARTVFSKEEVGALAEAGPQASAAFLRGWTRKEAYVKALGVGIGIELRAVTVGLELSSRRISAQPGISTSPLDVHSVQSDEHEHIAIACSTNVGRIERHEIDTRQLLEFGK